MWDEEVQNKFREFAVSLNKIHIWVSDGKLLLSSQFPTPSNFTHPEQYLQTNFLYVAKNQPIEITEENFNKIILTKTLNKQKIFTDIVEDISQNLVKEILLDEKWPQNIKKELLISTHKFLANVTELRSKTEKVTILYVPNEILFIPNLQIQPQSVEYKDMIQRLELVLVYWTKQIKEVLNNQVNETDSDNNGPLQEIEFWRNAQKNLLNINQQLQNKKVNKILEELRLNTNANQLKNFQKITDKISFSLEQASDNLKYLKILEQPCKILLELTSEEIPSVLNKIFFCIRLLWEKCKYYQSEEKIANLFRKVSNEIIQRCGVTINLEDLFEGNVQNCMKELNLSKQCGQKWREVYEANTAAMSKEHCWTFEANYIFAQIDAFVQRCNDLQEICEGQIQFARKGKEDVLSYFSGNKSSDIIFILNEINDSFNKHLFKLSGKNKQRILDIKSTQWHDDYNVFKQGMKNLDNMYINLVNFAFDNVNSIELAVEYMILFQMLTQRETIKIHVDKKIEKVNQIALKELRSAEALSKTLPDYRYYPGKFAAKGIWIKNLLSRIQRIKYLFDKLGSIDKNSKEMVDGEYFRIERNFKNLILESFQEFKEKNKDLNQTLGKRLDQNILIEGSLAKNKSLAPRSVHPIIIQRRERIGFIECNFDKVLLSFFEEVKGFQKLSDCGVNGFGGRSEEIANGQSLKLRVFRENVMIVVREYNEILKILSPFERSLFQDHLDKITNTINRGVKILRWSSHGTLDNFVKECKAKCSQLHSKILEFKKGTTKIEKMIKREIEKMDFVSFDSRTVLEIDLFVKKQEQTRHSTQQAIQVLFENIKDILGRLYDFFINKSLRVQKHWFEYIKKLDQIVEEEFIKTSKSSLQEFLKAISGDEKTNTNPTQIFRIFIVLHVNSPKPNTLDFNPKISDFQDKIGYLLKKIIGIFGQVKKLSLQMFSLRTEKIQQFVEQFQGDHQKKSLNKQLKTNFVEITKEILNCDFEDYEMAVHRELESLVKEIRVQLESQCLRLSSQLEPWLQQEFVRNTGQDTNQYKEKMLFDINTPIQTIMNEVAKYDYISTQIQEEKNSDDSVCIHVDNSKIKSKLGEINYNEQKNLLSKIKDMAIRELSELNKKFEEAETKFAQNPTDLQKLDESMRYAQNLFSQKGKIAESLIPLEEKFRLLDENMMVFKEEETKLRVGIRVGFDSFCKMLDDVKARNDNFYLSYQKDHQKKLESFEKEIREQKEHIMKVSPVFAEEKLDGEKAQIKIAKFRETMLDIKTTEKELSFGFNLFKINYIPIPEIEEIEFQIKNLEGFWFIHEKYQIKRGELEGLRFAQIQPEQINSSLSELKTSLFDLNPNIKKWEVFKQLKEEIEYIEKHMQLVELLQDEAIRPRHWQTVIESLKENIQVDSPEFTLAKILDLNFLKIQDIIRQQQETAFSEFKIESALKKVVERWQQEELHFDKIKISQETIIDVTYMDKVQEYLEEDLVLLSSLKTNINAKFFQKDIEKWDYELNRVSEIMDLLLNVQKKFIYFNNIFLNLKEEIGQLKGDKSNFQNVKKVFLQYMKDFQELKNTKECLLISNFKETLQSLFTQLETIQKNMRKYLEKRRYEIPRFYFLSDEDIFEILGKAKDPNSINKNLKKMFEGIKQLDFISPQNNKGKIEYTHMVSPCGEKVEFNSKIEVNGDLNFIIKSIENEMILKLQMLLGESMNYLKINNLSVQKDLEKIEKWLTDFPGQVLLLSSQLGWTNKMEDNLQKNQEQKKQKTSGKDEWTVFKTHETKFINDLVLMIRKKITPILKNKLLALITIVIHHRDIIDPLQMVTPQSFEWTQQLRFYGKVMNEDSVLVDVKQGQGIFPYIYEYQGNNGRLVITPLTDKCYLTLTTALHYKRGGNPQGPAGTGKTETVKDLGKNLGRYVFVYNCSEGIDVKKMRDLFEGLIMTGFWGCFDEFNRIEIEVLSVLAIQINSILEAVVQNKDVFDFEEKELLLNKNCALFITMNPTYTGRTELPDNIKNLFRPVSMMVPDSQQICRISLQSEGFKFADILSKKIDSLYKFMKQNLSRQQHYDFGLRAIKSVLNLAGDFRRNQKKKELLKKEQDQMFEQRILIKSILAINEPKLVSGDLILFEALLNDVFQEEIDNTREDNEELLQHIDKVMDELNLDKNPYFVEKLIQFYNTKQSRHGNIVIGESMSGKSALVDVIRRVQERMGTHTKMHVLNPKVFTIHEIYGFYDSAADESKIGVFSYLMSELCSNEELQSEFWIMFDGPIDTKWIESMNSLLDDNKVLTLLDGNRINLKSNVKIIFEVDELTQASPATVSRCGMLFVDARELSWRSVFTKWILEKDAVVIPDSLLDFLEDLSDKWIEPLLKLLQKLEAHSISKTTASYLVQNFTRLFNILFDSQFASQFPQEKLFKASDVLHSKIEKLFVFCVVWTLGINLDVEGRMKFDHFMRDIEGLFPFQHQVFDYFLNFEKSDFFPWESKLTISPQQYKPAENQKNGEFLVETVDTLRQKYLLQILLENGVHTLNIGQSGVGKTLLMKQVLFNFDESQYSFNVVNLTPGTNSRRLQETLESKLNRTTKKKFRPFSGKKGLIYLDNLSLPKKDPFGYQPPLELVRQLLQYQGWYD